MQLPEFLFCTNSTLPGVALIIQTESPYLIGQVIQFSSRSSLDDFVAKKQANDGFFIGGKTWDYNILIVFCGSLTKQGVQLNTQQQADELATIYRKMADFYFNEKIVPNARAYRKYKES